MNDLTPSRYFTAKLKTGEDFILAFKEDKFNKETPFEVHFPAGHTCKFFDIDTIGNRNEVETPNNLKDRVLKAYY